MKKLFLSLAAISMLSLTSNAFAGGVKNLLIDAEEAIAEEFYPQGLQVESVSNHQFTPVNNGIGVKADVETINPKDLSAQSWTCVVTFVKVGKEGTKYSPTTVDCE